MTRWRRDRRSGGRWALATALVLVGACSDPEEPTVPAVRERSWDVLGVVTAAEHLPGYGTTGGAMTMGDQAVAEFTVGPIDLVLADGTRLHVPAETPGGNACLPLMTEVDRRFATGMASDGGVPDRAVRQSLNLSDDCVVIAALGADDAVEWFQILGTDRLGRASVGNLVERRGSGLLTESGFVFNLAPDADLGCGSEPRALETFFEPDRWEEAAVDVSSGDIVAIECLSRM